MRYRCIFIEVFEGGRSSSLHDADSGYEQSWETGYKVIREVAKTDGK